MSDAGQKKIVPV